VTERLEYLDGLRAVAALYVVLFHALGFVDKSALSPAARAGTRLLAFGHDAVAIFIVLSGYCLTLPVARAHGRLTGGARGYLLRRARRILPPYYVALAASLALLMLVPALREHTGTTWDESNPAFSAGTLLSHALLVHNLFPTWVNRINGPLWSVATEWQIYFFFPFVLLPLWRRAGVAPMLAVAFGLGYLPAYVGPLAPAAESAITWYLGGFALGMVAAAVGFSDRPAERALRGALPWGPLAATAWALCAVGGLAFAKVWFLHKHATDALVALATALLLVYCSGAARDDAPVRRPAPLVRRFLESRPMVVLGRFSYSLYLTHLPVLALCFLATRGVAAAAEGHLALMIALGTPAAMAWAYAFFWAFERPFLRAAPLRSKKSQPVSIAPSLD
jgi:peptidoglycan/LPS O-acetylase OafA/YrhL